MGTSSSISVKKSEEEILSIYCNYDGYVSHVGTMLFKYYNTLEKALELVSYGDASSIHSTIEGCEFYHRDRGRELRINKISDFSKVIGQDYNYEFIDGAWYVDWNEETETEEWILLERYFKTEARKQKINKIINNLNE